jgi:hypothetical protein
MVISVRVNNGGTKREAIVIRFFDANCISPAFCNSELLQLLIRNS